MEIDFYKDGNDEIRVVIDDVNISGIINNVMELYASQFNECVLDDIIDCIIRYHKIPMEDVRLGTGATLYKLERYIQDINANIADYHFLLECPLDKRFEVLYKEDTFRHNISIIIVINWVYFKYMNSNIEE